jgi:hypothetical protein
MLPRTILISFLFLYPYCSLGLLVKGGILLKCHNKVYGWKSSLEALSACLGNSHSFRDQQRFVFSAARRKDGQSNRNARIFGSNTNSVESTIPRPIEKQNLWDSTIILGQKEMKLDNSMGDANGYYAAARMNRRSRNHDHRKTSESRSARGLTWLEHHEGQSLLDDLWDLRARITADTSPGLDHFNAIMNKCAGSVRCPAVGTRGVQVALEVLSLMQVRRCCRHFPSPPQPPPSLAARLDSYLFIHCEHVPAHARRTKPDGRARSVRGRAQVCGVVPDAYTFDRLLEACAGAALQGSQVRRWRRRR